MPVWRATVFVGAGVGVCVVVCLGVTVPREDSVPVGDAVVVFDGRDDFVVVRLAVVEPVVVVVALIVFDTEVDPDVVVDPDAVFDVDALPVVVADGGGDFDKRVLRVRDGEPDDVRDGGNERVGEAEIDVVFDRVDEAETVGLPLTDLLTDDDDVVVFVAVLVRVDDGDPVCVAVSLADHDMSGDVDELFDAVVVRVEVLEAVVVSVPNQALGVRGFVGRLVTDARVERVLVFEAVADVVGTMAKMRASAITNAPCASTGGEKDDSNSTNNNASRIMVSTWTIGLDLIIRHVLVL